MNLSVEHVLMIILVAFALHYLMRNCGCRRVEGVSNLKEGACCNSGDCADGLECNMFGAGTQYCRDNPPYGFKAGIESPRWYGACQKETHWMADFWGGLMKGGPPTQAWNGKW